MRKKDWGIVPSILALQAELQIMESSCELINIYSKVKSIQPVVFGVADPRIDIASTLRDAAKGKWKFSRIIEQLTNDLKNSECGESETCQKLEVKILFNWKF
jgi:Zn-dependent alcohol dehydrogenase